MWSVTLRLLHLTSRLQATVKRQRRRHARVQTSECDPTVDARVEPTTTYWHCSVHNKCQTCPATVTQYNTGDFVPGQHAHNHPASLGIDVAKPLMRMMKDAAVSDMFKPAPR